MNEAYASQDPPVAMKIIRIFILALFLLGIVGTIIELTKWGDISNIDYKRFTPVQGFKSIKQYEPILLQRKKPWAQFALVFSALRNFMHLSYQPRAY